MLNKRIEKLAAKVLNGNLLARKDALSLVSSKDIYDLLYCANKIREFYKGSNIHFCSIINAKSGACPEDCKFCSQSVEYKTNVNIYPMLAPKKIINAAKKTKGVDGFSIVTSGKKISRFDMEKIFMAVNKISGMDFYSCASLGHVTFEEAKKLKENGLDHYHHNLETSKRFFSKICTTHTFEDRITVIKNVKKAGLKVCCGGIFGIGETWEDRVDLALTIRSLNVDSVPINFLNPRAGTPLGSSSFLNPLECLKIIALFRFILPRHEIVICGGREVNLRDLQSWIYYAGASGSMTGNYLTTKGRGYKQDLMMLKDLDIDYRLKDCKI